MDRSRLIAVAAAFVLMVGCVAAPGRGKPLAPGEAPTANAIGFGKLKTLRQFALAYEIELNNKYIVSVELTTEFNLVVRDRQGSVLREVYLDAPTYDINALVIGEHNGFVASSAGWVRGYDLRTGEKTTEWYMGSGATALALDQEREHLLIGTQTGVLCLRRLSDGAQLQCVVAHEGRVGAIDIINDRVASASWGGELSLWRLPGLRREHQLPQQASIADVAWAPDGKTLAVARNQRPPQRTPADTKKRDYSPSHNVIELWSISASGPSLVRRLKGHRSVITSVAWLGKDLLSGSWDRSLRLWSGGKRITITRSFEHLVRDVATTPIGGWFVVAAWAPKRESLAIVQGRLFY